MKTCKKSIIFAGLIIALAIMAIGCTKKKPSEQETTTVKGDSAITVKDWNGVTVKSVTDNKKEVTLLGNGISVVYDENLKTNVLAMEGTGYLEINKDIFADVTEGFTVAFNVKLSENCPDDANIIQFNPCGYATGDKQWRDAPEISIKANLLTTFYIGGRTISGTFNPSATYNNGIAGVDDLAYAEPGGHKTRYAATAGTSLNKGEWAEVVLSVSKTGYALYVNGAAVTMTDTVSGSDIASSLDYLFGDDILKTYTVNSIGNSVYGDGKNFEGQIDNLAIYKKALSADEVAALSQSVADYKWDFSNPSVNTSTAIYKSDITTYIDGTKVEDVDLGDAKLVSPDGKLNVLLKKDVNNNYYIATLREETVLLEVSKLGLVIEGIDLSTGLALDTANIKVNTIDETFTLNTGSGKVALNKCKEVVLPFTKDNAKFNVVVRVYDDGFAYKYEDVTVEGKDKLVVRDEASEFIISNNATVWAHQINGTYEAEYVKRNYKQLYAINQLLSTPLLVESDGYYMLFTESGVFNNDGEYCSSGLATPAASKKLVWTFGLARDPNRESTGELDSPGHINIEKVETINGFSTPWRTAIISNDVEKFVTSDLVAALNDAPDPELFADTSYITPGKCAWSWWAEEAGQGDYNKHVEYIDFAAENGWDVVTVDVGWRKFENRLADLCDYAESKGIKIIVWVNYRDIKNLDRMDELFSKWAAAGAAGLKTDYFESDEAHVLYNMQMVAETAAKYKLMVVYHGCVRPAGEYRTYPNVLTMEAVLGEESHKWSTLPTVENCLLYAFTRNVLGSMDYTPTCAMTNNGETPGFAISKAVIYQSALQHFANAAVAYKRFNGLSLLNNIPVVWDDTVVYGGAPDEYISLMRYAGDEYYLGAMTLKERKVEYTLDFLGDGEYTAYIYGDDEEAKALKITTQKVKKGDKLSFDLLKNGGVAVMITKKEVNLDCYEELVDDTTNYTFYEAEASNNTLAGAAKIANALVCSGGKKVGYVGYKGNTLTMNNIKVDADGTYEVILYYCSGENRKVTVTVNGTDVQNVDTKSTGSYDVFGQVTFTVQLKAGENTIMFSNDSYYAPDLDRIAVSKKAQ